MKTILKALNILDLMLSDKDEISCKDIIESTGLSRATTYRILSVLTSRGYLKKLPKKGKYSVGIRLIDISINKLKLLDKRNTDIPHIIVQLSKLVNESVYFAVWYGSDILLSRSFGDTGSLESVQSDWVNHVLHQTCLGKIILANMSSEDLNSYLNRMSLLDNNHIKRININQIKTQIALVRRENLAFEEDERQYGVSGVAAGVRNKDGEIIGAIFIMGSSNRLTHSILEKIAVSCQRCASKISSELGFRG
jgi:IclR family transcriptional regulator, KDG regulon repressor